MARAVVQAWMFKGLALWGSGPKPLEVAGGSKSTKTNVTARKKVKIYIFLFTEALTGIAVEPLL